MLNDTLAKKRAALDLLAAGYVTRRICLELGIRRAKIRQWKDTDGRFRDAWNKLMGELGRWVEDEGD